MSAKEKFEELFLELSKKSEIRPYNEHCLKDGNWHFIHRTDVSNTMVKIRKLIEELESEVTPAEQITTIIIKLEDIEKQINRMFAIKAYAKEEHSNVLRTILTDIKSRGKSTFTTREAHNIIYGYESMGDSFTEYTQNNDMLKHLYQLVYDCREAVLVGTTNG